MRIWDDVIPAKDRELYERIGWGRNFQMGERPALLLVDLYKSSLGDRREPQEESTKRFLRSCGNMGWAAIDRTKELLEVVRRKGFPVIYSTSADRSVPYGSGRGLNPDPARVPAGWGREICDEVKPRPEDIVIYKWTPSVFFGTMLQSHLTAMKVDTLIVTGEATSGCVRGTVLDASSYKYNVFVVEECTYDRSEVVHKVNLFDMHMKYAEVIQLERMKGVLERFPDTEARPVEQVLR